MAKMGRPKAENPKDKRIGIRMTAEEYNHLIQYAKQCNQSISEAVQQLIRRHCHSEENDK